MKKFCVYFLLFTTIGVFPSYSFNPRDNDSKEEVNESFELDDEIILSKDKKKKNKIEESDDLSNSLSADNTKNSKKNVKSTETKTNKKVEKISASDYYKKAREAYLTFTTKGYEDSITLYNKALEADKNYVKALAGKAEAQALLSRNVYDSTNSIKESSKLESASFENAYISVDINPNISETHRALSMVYYIQKKYEEGKEEALKAIDLDKDDAEAYLLAWLNSPDKKLLKKDNENLGFYRALNIDSEYIDKSLDLNPDLQLSLLELGNTFSAQSENLQAIRYYKKLLKINPSNEDGYIALGKSYNTTADYDNAVIQFEKALEINPDRYDALYGLGISYLRKRDSLQSQDFLNKACDYEFEKACEMLDERTRRNRRLPRSRRQYNNINLFNN